MMIMSLCIILLCLSIAKPKNRYIFIASLIVMWIIMTFITGNADESVYLSRYNNSLEWALNSEPLFQLLNTVCKNIGLSFIQYKCVLSCIILLLMGSTIYKLSKYPNLVLVFYFLCPFPLNVSQLRFALATSIFVYGYRYLIFEDKRVKKILGKEFSISDIKFAFCVILASLVHSVSVVWLILLLVKKLTVKQDIAFTALFSIFIYGFFNPSSVSWLLKKLGAFSRMSAYFSDAYQNSSYRKYGLATITVIGLLGIYIICCLLSKKNKGSTTEQIETLLKFNIFSLSMIAFILRYTSEMYRPQEGLMLLNYILLTNQYENGKMLLFRGKKKEVFLKLLLFLAVIMAFVLKILLFNYTSVWKPMFF